MTSNRVPVGLRSETYLSSSNHQLSYRINRMYSSTFIFATKQFDDVFHQLDQTIAEVAKTIPGYIGEGAWENASTGLTSNVYYRESLDALQMLIQHPAHLEAKAGLSNWLDGYPVIISEVIRTYADGVLSHIPGTPAAD